MGTSFRPLTDKFENGNPRHPNRSSKLRPGRLVRLGIFTALLLGTIFIIPTKSEAYGPMAGCQCTDFVYSQRPDLPRTMGRAKDFLYSSRIHRFPYDQVPQVGDVAVFLRGEFGFSARLGHVALVVDVNESMDRFSIVGWNGLKADCILEIDIDLPVTKNTFFIHHKEPIRFQTLSLEQWKELAGEQKPRRFGNSVTCEFAEFENASLGLECPEDSNCCQTTESSPDIFRDQLTRNSLSKHLNYLNFP